MKFGIIGPGGIARRFADAVSRIEDVEIAAVASKTKEKAAAFAEEFGIAQVCADYDELVHMPEIDAVYVSVVHPQHFAAAKKCIEAGKPVLCEKPLCMREAETTELTALAEEKGVLLMEAIWTLHLPCIKKAYEWLRSGRIGTAKYMESSFSFYNKVDRTSRLFAPELGGGAALDVGIYTLAISLFLANQNLKSCKASVYNGETGVDEMGAALLQFEDGMVANCRFGTQATIDDSACVYGDAGSIELPKFWSCRRAVLKDAQGQVVEEVTDSQENGFVYEILAFKAALESGKKEVQPISHAFSRTCARLMDEIIRSGAV